VTDLDRTVLKQPNSAYLIVGFVAICVTAVVRSLAQLPVYLIPLAGALYIARTATIVDSAGITARALLGSQQVPWASLRGLKLTDKGAVYAVDTDGTQLRLPCVRSTKLTPLITAGGGRIPDPAS
jgi:hypothetical protein